MGVCGRRRETNTTRLYLHLLTVCSTVTNLPQKIEAFISICDVFPSLVDNSSKFLQLL